MKYTIDIIETLKKKVDIEADTYYEAVEKAEKMYHNSEVILTADDFDNVEFNENFGSAIARQPIAIKTPFDAN